MAINLIYLKLFLIIYICIEYNQSKQNIYYFQISLGNSYVGSTVCEKDEYGGIGIAEFVTYEGYENLKNLQN